MNETTDLNESLPVAFNKSRRPRLVIESDEDSDNEEVIIGSDIEDSFEKEAVVEVQQQLLERFEKEKKTDTYNNKDKNNLTDEDDDVTTVGIGNISNYSDDIVEDSGEEVELNNYSSDENVFTDNDLVSSTKANITDGSLEIIQNSLNVVEISSDDDAPPIAQNNVPLQKFAPLNLHNHQPDINIKKELPKTPTNLIKKQEQTVSMNKPFTQTTIKTAVKESQYMEQCRKISNIEEDLLKSRNAKRIINLEQLPDKGKSLLEKEASLEKLLQEQKQILSNMVVIKETKPENKLEVKWDEIEAGVDAVGPRTFGKIGVARFNAEKELAIETLDELHKSLATCPTDKDLMEDPKGLKVPLMRHQKRALAWLMWRENQKPSGGLLADDMGLGKTLTMISLVIKALELERDEEKENRRAKYDGGTLVVCPASLLNQWSSEIDTKTKRGLLTYEVHHGSGREQKAKRLAKSDIVISTYATVRSESDRDGTIYGVRWRRIILDEAHQIRNFKSQTSEAVFKLSGKSRWALTGTPIQNKETDMYAILKFLRCSPFDDLKVWKHWVGDKSTGGQMRLHAVVSSLMLRRTKEELMNNGDLKGLPEKTWQLVSLKLDRDETYVYQKVLIFSRTLFAQFLHQRAEKNQDAYDMKFNRPPPDPNGEYFKMRNKLLKLNRVKEVSQHEILVLLLRLRQICCHPSLIVQMLQGDEDLGNAESDEESEELNLLEQLNKLDLNDEEDHVSGISEGAVGLREASKGYLNPSNPVFAAERASSKISTLIGLLKNKICDDKAIIVSQWTGFLQRVAIHLRKANIIFDSLDGTIPVHKRMPIVSKFNDPNSDVKVLLLSLTAGGVGLNLMGANHLFLLDLHWNPQLENQAQDRIYRMGQKKPIYVYKLMAEDSIEERIKDLQERKLDIANSLLTGSKRISNNKLSLQDLKMLFDFK